MKMRTFILKALMRANRVLRDNGEHMTYEYICENCKHTWETEQSIKAEPIKICPKCNEEKAKRLIAGCNFILQGGGWAMEGYK